MADVVAVHASSDHTFSKTPMAEIELVAGIGVVGDAHAGARVRHRSRVRADPTQPNLRQVHLIAVEVLDELSAGGFPVAPGELGENLTVRGLDLLGLPVGTTLCIGEETLLSVTGYRNPCGQINGLHEGLMARMRPVDDDGELAPQAGIMTVVVHGGSVRPGDAIELSLPPGPHRRLQRV